MNKFRPLIFYIFVFIACVAQPIIAQVSVQSKVDKNRIHIGDLVQYEVIYNYEEGIEIQPPGLGGNLGAFEIRSFDDLPPESTEDGFEKVVRYTISTFDTGMYVIPPIMVGYTVLADSSELFLETQPIEIYVESLKPSEQGDIRGLKAQAEIPFDWAFWLWVGGAALLVIGLAIFGWWYYKKKKQGGLFTKPEPPPRPAHEIAFEKLNELVATRLIENGEVKAHYIQLSEIMREYIENRFFIPALESTTDEICAAFERDDFSDVNVEILRQDFQIFDLVKFAKFTPESEFSEQSLQRAFQFVDRTKIVFDINEDDAETQQIDNEKVKKKQEVPAE